MPDAIIRTKDMMDEDETYVDEPLKLSQRDTNYVMQSSVDAVCQTCRFFVARRTDDGALIKNECAIVECYPLEIVAGGHCDMHNARPATIPEVEAQYEPPAPMEVVIVEPADMPDTAAASLGGKGVGYTVADAMLECNGFKALGNRYFVATYTNAYWDRDGECLPLIEHKRYVARVKSGLVPYPELWRKHIAGTRHGQAIWLDVVGNMVVAVGQFDDTPEGRQAEKYYLSAKPGTVTMSHGFNYQATEKREGVYGGYNTFEFSTLDAGEEANPFTTLEAVKELAMAGLSKHQKDDITQVFGEYAPKILARVEAVSKADDALKQLGVEHKAFARITDGDIGDVQNKTATPESVEAETALKLFADLSDDFGGFANNQLTIVSGLKAFGNDLKTFAARIKRLEDELALPVFKAGEGDAVDESPDSPDAATAQTARLDLKAKQQTMGEEAFWNVSG